MFDLKIDRDKCTGCGRCLTACSIGREFSAEKNSAARLSGMQKAPPLPLLRLKEGANGYRIDLCRHCEKPLCVDACVAGAISVEPGSGTVQIAAEKCVGCWSCVMECPFAAIRLIDGGKAAKCNRCLDLGMPMCARFCPTGALQAVRRSARRRERAALIGKVSHRRQRG